MTLTGVCGLGKALGSRYGARRRGWSQGSFHWHMALRRSIVVIHGEVLLLAAYYTGERALIISVAPFIGGAPLCLALWRWRGSFGLPLTFQEWDVKACGLAKRLVALGSPLPSVAGHDGLDIFGRSCRRLRTLFLMCVSLYKASSRDHCCPRWSDALPRACDQLTKALGYSPYKG